MVDEIYYFILCLHVSNIFGDEFCNTYINASVAQP
jgi:hypothetical protein